MPKGTQTKSRTRSAKIAAPVNPVPQKSSFWDIIKFGESYTSLILGIIVVVVATVMLLTFVKGKNVNPNLSGGEQQKVAVKTQQEKVSPTPEATKTLLKNEQINPTKKVVAKVVVSPTITKKISPTVKLAKSPTVKPVVKEKQKIAIKTEKEPVNNQTISGSKYTVKEGDTLWKIAESKYKSGYNWVDIQKANNITNPDVLYVGSSITLPDVQPKLATVAASAKGSQTAVSTNQTNKIVGNNYTIAKGDTLWDIALRAYGDGYSWQKIARANNLSNPSVIHSGNKITIPRG